MTQENVQKYDPRNHADPSTIALTLVLDSLGLTLKDDRSYIHNVFLVACCAGLPSLGYHFGWYGDGQYSISLANDLGQVEYLEYAGGCSGLSLKKKVQEQIEGFLPILSPPEGLDQKSWVNLLAVALWGIDHNDESEQQTILSVLIGPHVRNKKSLEYLDKALDVIKEYKLSYDKI